MTSQQQKERNGQIVRLFRLGISCRGIAEIVGLTYEGIKYILQKEGQMGFDKEVKRGL